MSILLSTTSRFEYTIKQQPTRVCFFSLTDCKTSVAKCLKTLASCLLTHDTRYFPVLAVFLAFISLRNSKGYLRFVFIDYFIIYLYCRDLSPSLWLDKFAWQFLYLSASYYDVSGASKGLSPATFFPRTERTFTPTPRPHLKAYFRAAQS